VLAGLSKDEDLFKFAAEYERVLSAVRSVRGRRAGGAPRAAAARAARVARRAPRERVLHARRPQVRRR